MPVSRTRPRTWAALRSTALFALLLGLSYACLSIPRAAGHLTPIWLPNAVLLAVLLASPRRAWTARIAVGMVGVFAGHLLAGSPLARAVGLTTINGIQVLIAARLVIWRFGRHPDITDAGNTLVYDVLMIAPALLGAGMASLFLFWRYGVSPSESLLTWGTSDFAGLITITPSVVVLISEWRSLARIDPRRLWPLALLIAVAGLVFFQSRYPYSYLVVAALMLASYRLGLAGAASGVLIALVAAVGGTLLGHGPFASLDTSLREQVLSLQLFLAVSFHLSVPVAFYRRRAHEMQRAVNSALREARLAEAKYRQITDAVQDLIVQTGPDGRLLYASPSTRVLGYEPEKLIGRSVFSLIHPDDRKLLRTSRNSFFVGGDDPPSGAFLRLRVRTRDGVYRLFESRPHMIRGPSGEPIALESVLRDVTDAVAAEDALKASEGRYRMLSEHMSDIVSRYGRDGVIRYASPSVQAVLGYSPEELVGVPITRLLVPEDIERVGAEFAAHREQGPTAAATFRVEFRMYRKDRSVAWLEAHPRPIFDAQTGEFIEWQDCVREIGERKALEAELTAAKVAAEAAANAKAEFLANMSHELRTPLTGVLGFTKLASAARGLAEPARTYVQRVDEASKALLALLNDILDFSKLEAGDVRFRLEPVSMSELARSCLRLFEGEAEEKGIHLEIVDRLPPGMLLELDADRMRQVLLNLVGNAVKFTDAGAVTLQLRFDRAAQALTVSIADTGPGIAPDRLGELFKRFSQVHDGARRYGGTGLGLAICRGIVEAQGGEIGVSSKLGQGSYFHFTLPTRPVRASARKAPPSRREKLSVLVADDSADLQDLVVLFLKDIADVTVAVDGRTAVRLAGPTRFDVMLLDARLPGLGGPAALQRIRAGSGPNRRTPAIALTADTGALAADRLRSQGFAAVVAKPFSSLELISTIAELMAPQREPEPPLPPPPASREPSMPALP